MAQAQVYEGTLDEITALYGEELSGLRLRVIVDDAPGSVTEASRPFYELATPDQWAEALRAWAAGHDPGLPLLSDAAVERESIYEGRGE